MREIQRITEDFKQAFKQLENIKPGVVCFASARLNKGPYYEQAVDLCRRLSEKGYNIITGAGPGLMEACNKGAQQGRGKSIGFQIELPNQTDNDYLDLSIKFKYFFSRKNMFARYGDAFIVFPGGFGTLDELFEILTLVQTGHLEKRPIILVGDKYWSSLMELLERTLQTSGTVSKKDVELVTVTNNKDKIIQIIDEFMKKKSKFSRNRFI